MPSIRIPWADQARGAAILLVLLGHACPPPYTTAFIYAFHMPLFFLLSGLFLQVDQCLAAFVRKKAQTLLLPFVVYNLVLLASDWCIVALSPNVHSAVDIPGRLLGTLTGWHGTSWNSSLWFLPCLFSAQLLVVAVARLTENATARIVLWLLLSAAGAAYCHWVARPLPMSLDSALVATGFLLAGRELMRTNLRREAWWYWAITIVVFISATLDNHQLLGGGAAHVDLSTDTLGRIPSFYVAAFGGSMLLVRGCQWLEASCPASSAAGILSCLGRNSLAIYCLHRIPMNLGIAIWNVALGSNYASTPASQLLRALAITAFTLLLLLPAVYIVNRWFPWTLGKPATATPNP